MRVPGKRQRDARGNPRENIRLMDQEQHRIVRTDAGQCSGQIIDATKFAVTQPVGNLIANARRYGQHVWLSSVPVEDGVDILVDDDGPGIPLADRDRAFQPFIRLDPSRNPTTGGVGLGLTIARDVARGHGGDLTLEGSPQGGLRARLHLPN